MDNSSKHHSGCLICGLDLVYRDQRKKTTCLFCEEEFSAEAECLNGHYVCDRCHGQSATGLIERTCNNSRETDPLQLADRLLKHQAVKMHGPEHHFLVAAVLIATCCTLRGESSRAEKLAIARKRAEDVKGGFCGTHGTCGAAMGAGIACSVLLGATPLAGDEWRLSNLLTAACLTAIGEAGGPRCCKRDSYLALLTGRDFLNRHLSANLPTGDPPVCTFMSSNKECLHSSCPFFPKAG